LPTIHVLHLITGLGVGGAERTLQQVVEGLDPARFRSTVVSLGDLGVVGGELSVAGVPVTAMGLKPGIGAGLGVRRLARLLQESRPDLVQTWMYHADLLGLLAARASGSPPLAWNVRGGVQAWSDLGLSTGLVMRLCAWKSPKPDVVVVNSEFGLRQHEAIGYRPRAWRLIRNGIDLRRFRPMPEARRAARAALKAEDDQVVFGVVGRYHRKKRIPEIVQAFGKTARSEPPALLALVGEGMASTNKELMKGVKRQGTGERVRLVGPTQEVPYWLNGMDVLVSASVSEGFPNVVAEAMACQVPCVATDVGDTRLLIGDCGEAIPAGDPEALGAAMGAMLALGSERRRRLGERARRRVEDEYGLERMIGAYQALYAELAARPDADG